MLVDVCSWRALHACTALWRNIRALLGRERVLRLLSMSCCAMPAGLGTVSAAAPQHVSHCMVHDGGMPAHARCTPPVSMSPGPELMCTVHVQTSGIAGEHLPSHVAVVRDAFGAHDDSHRRLAQEVAALGPDKVRLLHAAVGSLPLISCPLVLNFRSAGTGRRGGCTAVPCHDGSERGQNTGHVSACSPCCCVPPQLACLGYIVWAWSTGCCLWRHHSEHARHHRWR